MHAALLCRDRLCRLALAVVLLSATGAAAQMPPSPYVAPTPTPNPSSSLVVPPPGEVPVSPSISGTAPGSLGGSGMLGATGDYLNCTNEVVNPPRSVLHTYHRRRHHYHYYAQ